MTQKLWIDGPNTNDYNMVHVILPDTHVPASPPLGYPRPSTAPLGNSTDFGSPLYDPQAWDHANSLDLFTSRQSIRAMSQFLNLLASSPLAPKIRLTQVGDMYELWMGRARLFTRKAGGPPGVALTAPGAAATIAGWIADTHEFFPDLFHAYDGCVSSLRQCQFIHGNHDSYLSVSDVISAANTEIGRRAAMVNGFRAHRPMVRTVVHPRQDTGYVFDRGIFIEHGQRVDVYNSDGNPAGIDAVNGNMNAFMGRTLNRAAHRNVGDSVRRASFVTGAAALWLNRGRDFGCYVMGHTHTPDLNYVEVTHRIVNLDAIRPMGLQREPKY